jgi:hypothetical protein
MANHVVDCHDKLPFWPLCCLWGRLIDLSQVNSHSCPMQGERDQALLRLSGTASSIADAWDGGQSGAEGKDPLLSKGFHDDDADSSTARFRTD